MMKKRDKKIDRMVVKVSDFEYAKDAICDNNRKAVLMVCPICMGIMLFLLTFGRMFSMGIAEKCTPVCIVALFYLSVILLLVAVAKKTNRILIMAATYLTIIGIMLYGIFVSYRSPEGYTVSFIVLVSIVSVIFVDKPWRFGLTVLLGTIACTAMSFFTKEESVRAVDMMNILSFSALSSLCAYFTIKMKVKGYVTTIQLKHLGEKDQLTDLYNRNCFDRKVDHYYKEARKSFGCVYVDVNGLHELNNTKGHTAGDEMLQFVASVIKNEFGVEYTYRIGGDEFAALALDISKADMMKKIDNMKSSIRKGGYHIAIGFEYTEGDISLSDTVQIAEKKMRENKRDFYASHTIADRQHRDYLKDGLATIEDKIQAYVSLLTVMSRNTSAFLFIIDIKNDVYWYFGAIDKDYNIRKPGSLINTSEQLFEVVYPADRRALREDLDCIGRGEKDRHNMNYRWVTRDGKIVWVNCRGTVIHNENGEPAIMVGRVSESALRHLYNPRSGFWNKEKLFEDLRENAWDGNHSLVLFEFINLAEINLTHGSAYGDAAVKEFGDIIEQHPAVLEVYHTSYNQFGAIVSIASNEKAYEFYRDIQKKIHNRFDFCGASVPISRKLFIDEKNLIDTAKFLLKKSRKSASNHFRVFEEEEITERIKNVALIEEFKQRIETGFHGFTLRYQPQIKADTLEVCGMEALLRYRTKEGNEIFPDTFIPLLEKTGLIKQVGLWVLEQALSQCKRWREELPDLTVSVNFSVVQFDDPGFTQKVGEVLHKTNMPGSALTVEITESRELFDNPHFEKQIRDLKAYGVQLSVDDFGNGYSNFDYLQALDVDEVKIDRLFVKEIEETTYHYTLIQSIMSFAKSNGICVCCEGVETEKELAVLEGLGADLFQGYLFDKPQTPKTIEFSYIDKHTKEFKKRMELFEKIRGCIKQ